MFGVFVPPTRGRSSPSGKMQKSVMPTTESPAPRSKRVSVSEGTSETTRRGGDKKSNSRPRMSRNTENDSRLCVTAERLSEKVVLFPPRTLGGIANRFQQSDIRFHVASAGIEVELLRHVVGRRMIDVAEPVAS